MPDLRRHKKDLIKRQKEADILLQKPKQKQKKSPQDFLKKIEKISLTNWEYHLRDKQKRNWQRFLVKILSLIACLLEVVILEHQKIKEGMKVQKEIMMIEPQNTIAAMLIHGSVRWRVN
jgi:hypothetical protein